MFEVFEDIEGIEVVVDDLLIGGESVQQHDSRLMQVLDRAREWNSKLNKHKCQIKEKDMISYIGHILTKGGSRPNPKKTNATIDMPSPKTKELGMLTYLLIS